MIKLKDNSFSSYVSQVNLTKQNLPIKLELSTKNNLNDVQQFIEYVKVLIKDLKQFSTPCTDFEYNQARKWLEAGEHDLQVGIMKLVRFVARPESFYV